MDASDEALVAKLSRELAERGYTSAMGKPEPAFEPGVPDAEPLPDDETGFLAAMGAYRAVKASGDAAAVARAEESLRAYVRGELDESCQK